MGEKSQVEKIIEEIGKLSVVELAELVEKLKEKFGVTAAAPAPAPAVAPSTPVSGEKAKEEKATFNVVLTDVGGNKIGVIKAIKELVPDMGLKEAKELVESAPKEVLSGVGKEKAEEAKKKLEEAGAKVELK